jgi:hypothetical protein
MWWVEPLSDSDFRRPEMWALVATRVSLLSSKQEGVKMPHFLPPIQVTKLLNFPKIFWTNSKLDPK